MAIQSLNSVRAGEPAQRTTALQKVVLDRDTRLSPQQIQRFQDFYNGILKSNDSTRVTIGDFEKALPLSAEDAEVAAATETLPGDDAETQQLRSDYQTAYHEVRRETTRAQRHFQRLGQGHHWQPNGELVEVGAEHVTVHRPDGSRRGAEVGGKRAWISPPEGEPYELTREGTTVTRADANGRETFSVKKGKPTRAQEAVAAPPVPNRFEVQVPLQGKQEFLQVNCQPQGEFREDKGHKWPCYRLDFTTLGKDIHDHVFCTLLVSVQAGQANPRQALEKAVIEHVQAVNSGRALKDLNSVYKVKPDEKGQLKVEKGYPTGQYASAPGIAPADVGNRQREKLMPTANGQVLELPIGDQRARIQRVGADGKNVTFQVQIAGSSFNLRASADIKNADLIDATRRVLQEFVKIPAKFRKPIKEIRLESGPSPDDAYWEKKHNVKGFRSAASAGGGVINIFNIGKGGNDQIEHAFIHEAGHLVGKAVRDDQAWLPEWIKDRPSYPEGWPDAMKGEAPVEGVKVKQGDKEINYSETNPTEDFAEAFSTYIKAMMKGELKQFEAKYPKRAKILAELVK